MFGLVKCQEDALWFCLYLVTCDALLTGVVLVVVLRCGVVLYSVIKCCIAVWLDVMVFVLSRVL